VAAGPALAAPAMEMDGMKQIDWAYLRNG